MGPQVYSCRRGEASNITCENGKGQVQKGQNMHFQ